VSKERCSNEVERNWNKKGGDFRNVKEKNVNISRLVMEKKINQGKIMA
jgi:hypothetical protein